MNTNNYATLDQSKRMKELGFPQKTTDAVWVFIPDSVEKKGKYKNNGWWLMPREDCWWGSESIRKYSKQISVPLTGRVHAPFITEWYAAPNRQEIHIPITNLGRGFHIFENNDLVYQSNGNIKDFGNYDEAQSAAAAYIFEKE